METLYLTLYPGPKSLVNAQLVEVHDNRCDVRLSAGIHRMETLFATFWLDPVPVNCHVRILATSEDPVTGELRASLTPIDLNLEERATLNHALLKAKGGYPRLRSAS